MHPGFRINPRVATVFIRALQNGVLSLRESRRLVAVALEELRNAADPDDELRAILPVFRAAGHLRLARTTREYIERFQARAGEIVIARSRDGGLGIDLQSPELRERIRGALARTLGNAGIFAITDLRHAGGRAWIELMILGTPIRVQLIAGDEGETVGEVVLDEPPAVLDPEIVATLEGALSDHLGPVEALAYAGQPGAGGTRWTVTLRDGAGVRALAAVVAEDGTAALGDFSYDPNEAREMSAQLALARGLGLAAPAGPLAQLEVLVRASMRTPDEINPVAPEDSPVPGDPEAEIQWEVPGVWGDTAVYVAFDRGSGAVRIEAFN